MNYKFLTLLAVLAVAVFSCKKEENKVTFQGGTAPVLSASTTGNVPLSFANRNMDAFTISWTNPAYQFNTGLNSQNVTYEIEIDTTGSNFTNPARKILSVSNDLSRTFTQGDFNSYLTNDMGLAVNRPHDIEIRVKSYLPNKQAMLVSNTIKVRATPYSPPPAVEPYTNEVFIVGNATAGGWNNPVPSPAQKMTQVGPYLYEITLPLIGGNSYLFLPVNGSWSQKYGFDGANNANPPLAGAFRREGGDMKAPDESGNYKIQLNFQTGRYSLTKL